MRSVGLLLLLALIGGEAVLAQVPDTLDPRGYFPLDVGNTWEYEHALRRPAHPDRAQDESATYRERYQILDSSTVGDTTFFSLLLDVRDEEDAVILRDTSRIWYDATEASIRGQTLGIIYWLRCLDAPFGRSDDDRERGCWSWAHQDEGVRLQLAGLEEPVTTKTFEDFVYVYSVVHGLGIIGGGGGCEPCSAFDDSDSWTLKYARVAGQEYGVRIVQAERSEPLPTDVLTVYPNPTHGAITVEAPEVGQLDVFDLLGRQVLTVDVKLPGRVTLDLAGYAPGLYVLRFEDQARTIIVQ